MKQLNIGLVGAGTVGQGLLEIISKSGSLVKERTGINLEIKTVCDKFPDVTRKYPHINYTSNYNDILNDKEIDIVVELVGGTTIAYEIVKGALLAGKTVVTANKALLSEKGSELFGIAKGKNVEIGYEASVAGTIPIIRSVKTGLVANDFTGIYGILNGTTNFILTKMEEDDLEYSAALKIAQDLGFAEKDPTFDVEGIDAAHKVTLLAGLAFNKKINIKDVYIEGISKISKTDILTAKNLGYRIKLLGICKKNGEIIEARVQPTMIPLSHPIANIRNEMNAIYLETNYSGSVMLSGKGAGSLPTASAIVSDIVFYGGRIGKNLDHFEENLFPIAQISSTESVKEKYYLRFDTIDRLGVLAEISKILGENKISISSMHQKESNSERVEVIIITHPAEEKNIRKALNEIDQDIKTILSKSVLLRIESLS
jgi:homoserine dehydrogenase